MIVKGITYMGKGFMINHGSDKEREREGEDRKYPQERKRDNISQKDNQS